ncbi:acyl-CoA dehydrogenase family protein [Serinicoccus kebangsaanensis]|uniref:acyl-CoA dehydrogenase family protein n=1 Tax=Serinicoccus kebangsaanensis TaxID=2602069 RepID=UPI00124C608B|nr:acyl-CoA dehydrogenase family protein [Serinicoccus kebangsaanensis]
MPAATHDLLDLDSLLTEDERAVRASVRQACADLVLPHVAGWYENGDLPAAQVRELVGEFGRLGLLGMHLEGYGCAGMGAVDYGLACTELEAADSGIRSMVSVQGSLAMHALHTFGSEEQRQEWLPAMAAGERIGCFGLTEPDHGSDPASMTTRARQDGSDWILDGTKTWITNAPVADVAVVWARTDDGVRGFVVPTGTAGVQTPTISHKLSLRASVTGQVVLEQVRLPGDAVLPGVRGLKGPLSCLSEARYGIVWGAMGAARTALLTALEYAGTREQFGRPISGFQLTQAKLARMHQAWATGTLLALHLGRRKDEHGLRPEQVSVGKLNNVTAALEICRTARTVLGANGISGDYPLMRHANNLESVLTYEGTEEMHTLVVGQALTGEPAYR